MLVGIRSRAVGVGRCVAASHVRQRLLMRRSSSAVGVVKKHTMRGKTRTPSVPHSLTSMDSIHRKTSTTAGDAVPMAVGGGWLPCTLYSKKWGSVRVNDNSCYASCTLVCFFGPHDRLLPLRAPGSCPCRRLPRTSGGTLRKLSYCRRRTQTLQDRRRVIVLSFASSQRGGHGCLVATRPEVSAARLCL